MRHIRDIKGYIERERELRELEGIEVIDRVIDDFLVEFVGLVGYIVCGLEI